MRLCILLAFVISCSATLAGPTPASTNSGANIAVVYNGEAEDAGFNQLILQGVRNFETQRRIKIRVYSHPLGQIFEGSTLEKVLAEAVPSGVDSVVLAGANAYGPLMQRLSSLYPHVRLVAIDGAQAVEGKVQIVQFRFPEAAYLAGIVAARATKTGTLGFVGGLDSPGIRAFGCAFAQGALSARPDIRVLGRMIGNQPTAFSDPAGGARRSRELLAAGADVVFPAAGGSGLGALKEIAAAGAYGIGVDDNQNGLHPGRMLTSVLKRMDVSVYTTLVALQDGAWSPGMQSVGLSEGAVGLAMDEHNRTLISAETRAELEAAEFAIRSGELQVIDAQVDASRCGALIEYAP